MAKTVALIELEETADAIERRLSDEGYTVRTAHDGEHGMKLLRNGSCDAMIANPEVLKMDCETFRSRVRAQRGNEFPVVLLSTWSSLESCRVCRDVFTTALRCVDEPANADEVLNQLQQLFDKVPCEPPAHGEETEFINLSRREKEVLSLLRRGMTNREIARQLCIVEKVVEKHIANVCAKLGVRNRTEAVALSYRHSVIAEHDV